MTWFFVKQRVLSYPGSSASWRSDQLSLLRISNTAEQWNIDDTDAYVAKMSNLRTIVPAAKRAIHAGDRYRLESLFSMARNLTTTELRIQLGYHREVIAGVPTIVSAQSADASEGISVTLTPEQFNRLYSSARRQFVLRA